MQPLDKPYYKDLSEMLTHDKNRHSDTLRFEGLAFMNDPKRQQKCMSRISEHQESRGCCVTDNYSQLIQYEILDKLVTCML